MPRKFRGLNYRRGKMAHDELNDGYKQAMDLESLTDEAMDKLFSTEDKEEKDV